MESPYPNVAHARAIARHLLRSARAGDREALARMPRSDRGPQLADAQFAVARAAGFPSWPALVRAATDWERTGGAETRTRLVLVTHPPRVRDRHYRQHTGPGLSEEGVRAARRLATRLSADSGARIDAVLSSHRPPSVETAAIVADALGLVPEAPTCELCDVHLGEAEGFTIAEYEVRYGSNAFVPGAETWPDLIARTTTGLRAIAERHRGQTVVCVTDNGVARASLAALGAADPGTASATPIERGSITEWSVLDEGDVRVVGTWQLDRLNDTSHLENHEVATT